MHLCIWNSTCFLWSYQVYPLVLDLYWPIPSEREEKHMNTPGSVWATGACGGLDMPVHHWGLSFNWTYLHQRAKAATVLVWTKRILCCSGHVYTIGAWAAPERVCLHYRLICCTSGCQQNRGLTCTWTCLNNRSLCWSCHVYIKGSWAAPGHVYTTEAFAAPRRVNKKAA
jgi:hypothetical protein